jgi:hypothetical protein
MQIQVPWAAQRVDGNARARAPGVCEVIRPRAIASVSATIAIIYVAFVFITIIFIIIIIITFTSTIRCINPFKDKVARNFDPSSVLCQVNIRGSAF